MVCANNIGIVGIVGIIYAHHLPELVGSARAGVGTSIAHLPGYAMFSSAIIENHVAVVDDENGLFGLGGWCFGCFGVLGLFVDEVVCCTGSGESEHDGSGNAEAFLGWHFGSKSSGAWVFWIRKFVGW